MSHFPGPGCPCQVCRKYQWRDTVPCPDCKGVGAPWNNSSSVPCERCGGTGRIAEPDAFGPLCPNCGQHTAFTEHSGTFTETHGLDCGPYETWTESWLTCNLCGAKTDEREVERCQKENHHEPR